MSHRRAAEMFLEERDLLLLHYGKQAYTISVQRRLARARPAADEDDVVVEDAGERLKL